MLSIINQLDPARPPCCVFGNPWLPPAPDFAKVLAYNETTPFVFGTKVGSAMWYTTGFDSPQDLAFGYGFVGPQDKRRVINNDGDDVGVPAGFFFNAVQGWCQQNFFNFNTDQPDPSIWNVPQSCNNAPACVV
jgi:hypothetical protein